MNHLETIKIYNNIPQSFIDSVFEAYSDKCNIKLSSVDDFDIDTYKLEITHYKFMPQIYKKEKTFYYLYIDSNEPIPSLKNTFNFQPYKNYENFTMQGTEKLFIKSLDSVVKRLSLSLTSNICTIVECD